MTARRLLWIQLGVPDASLRFASGNLPLAAHQVLALARLEGRLEGFDVEVLDSSVSALAGDASLLRTVLERDPDLLCATVYAWNAERTTWLVRRMKEARPGLRVILGGPEMVHGSPFWMDSPADVLVDGEGETGFPLALEALESLEAGGPGPIRIQSPPLAVLAGLPEPHSQGGLAPSQDGSCLVETMRGCPCRCHYCFYSKRSPCVRRHDPDRLDRFLDWAQGIPTARSLYLLDPSFDATPDLPGRLEALASRRGRALRLHTEMRLEAVSPLQAESLRRAGFASLETGLQSIHPAVCAGVGRRLDLARFTMGARAVREAGIELETGVILGLPGDTPERFSATLDWLEEEGLAEGTQVFLLSLLPGTLLRDRALAEGWRFQASPPYYLLEGGGWDEESLRSCVRMVERTFGKRLHAPVPPWTWPEPTGPWLFRGRIGPGTPLGASTELAARAGCVCTADIRLKNWNGDLDEAVSALETMRRELPFGLLRALVQAPDPGFPGGWERLQKSLGHCEGPWTRLNRYAADGEREHSSVVFARVPAGMWGEWWDQLPAWVPVVLDLPASERETDSALDTLQGFPREGEAWACGSPETPAWVRASEAVGSLLAGMLEDPAS